MPKNAKPHQNGKDGGWVQGNPNGKMQRTPKQKMHGDSSGRSKEIQAEDATEDARQSKRKMQGNPTDDARASEREMQGNPTEDARGIQRKMQAQSNERCEGNPTNDANGPQWKIQSSGPCLPRGTRLQGWYASSVLRIIGFWRCCLPMFWSLTSAESP